MLKRGKKITSLLVTAASIVSMVPAMAADAKKVESEEGTVYQAKAEPGATYLDAELNGEDEAVYVYKDGKYTKLDGADSGDTFGDIFTYDGETYLQMADGDYYVNVETGERTDDDIKENINDDADSVLKKAVKSDNDGRFADSNFDGNIVEAETDHGASKTLYGGATCRRYNYELDNPFMYDGSYTKDYSAIFSDDKGNYIDADYNLGSIGVRTTSDGVTVKNTEDTYELDLERDGETVTYEIKAEIQNLESFSNDADYIYRTAALSIWGKVKGTSGGFSENLTSEVYFGSASNHYNQHTDIYTDAQGNTVDCSSIRVMQKISKAQASDDIDGIKYSKDTKTYFITDDEGKDQPLFGLSESNNAASNSSGYGWFIGGTQGYIVSQFRDVVNKRLYAETINFKSSNGYNYIDVDDADSVDVESIDNDCAIGCGDLYALSDDGYIEEFIAKDSKFEKLYKVDGGMNKISISLPMFAAVWNEDDEIYSLITPGASSGDTTAATDTTTDASTTPATKAGWAKSIDGTWSFVREDGTKATGWLQDGVTWYYLNTNGVMATGWINDNGTWYYLNSSGAMQIGWINDNGTWYYCNVSGAMLGNTTVDGYVLGANGAWVK
jgi:hypothetical protein